MIFKSFMRLLRMYRASYKLRLAHRLVHKAELHDKDFCLVISATTFILDEKIKVLEAQLKGFTYVPRDLKAEIEHRLRNENSVS